MIAEIYGKAHKQTEGSEDELTGNFFGNLRYLSFNVGLKHILQRGLYPNKLADIFDDLDIDSFTDNISYI
jgi:hypothetical protein